MSRAKNYVGNLIGNEYEQKLGEMKAKFIRAKEDFDRSIRLEVFTTVVQNGADIFTLSSFSSYSRCIRRIRLTAGDPS